MAKDYYGILNISRNATDDEIKKAYRKLAIKYHPDKNKSAAAEERFKEIAEAYELLTDKRKRNIYDQYRTGYQNYDDMNDCRNPKGGIFTYHFHGDPRATFAQFFGAANPFGAFYGTNRASAKFETSNAKFNNNNESDIKSKPMSSPPSTAKSTTTTTTNSTPTSPHTARSTSGPTPTSSPTSTQCNNDMPPTLKATNTPAPKMKPTLKQDPPIEYDLYVTLEDIESGCTKKMRILRMVVEENGQKRKEEKVLSISIKPGWKEGTKITFQKEGDRLPNMIPADIIFIIRDKPHPLFKREGSDIRYKAKISLKRALCGTVIEVPTLQGDHIIIDTHAEVIEPNTVKCFAGRGLPFHREPNKRGNLLVDIVIKFPESLQTDAKIKINDALPD